MSLTDDLRSEIVTLGGNVANMRGDIGRLAAKIAELLAGGGGISQTDGEALLAGLRAVGVEAQAGADQTPDDQP